MAAEAADDRLTLGPREDRHIGQNSRGQIQRRILAAIAQQNTRIAAAADRADPVRRTEISRQPDKRVRSTALDHAVAVEIGVEAGRTLGHHREDVPTRPLEMVVVGIHRDGIMAAEAADDRLTLSPREDRHIGQNGRGQIQRRLFTAIAQQNTRIAAAADRTDPVRWSEISRQPDERVRSTAFDHAVAVKIGVEAGRTLGHHREDVISTTQELVAIRRHDKCLPTAGITSDDGIVGKRPDWMRHRGLARLKIRRDDETDRLRNGRDQSRDETACQKASASVDF